MSLEQHSNRESTEAVALKTDVLSQTDVTFAQNHEVTEGEKAQRETELHEFEDQYPDFDFSEVVGGPGLGITVTSDKNSFFSLAGTEVDSYFFDDNQEDEIRVEEGNEKSNQALFTEKINDFTSDICIKLSLSKLNRGNNYGQDIIDEYRALYVDNARIPGDTWFPTKSDLNNFRDNHSISDNYKVNAADHPSIANDHGGDRSSREAGKFMLHSKSITYDNAGHIKVYLPITKTVYPKLWNKKTNTYEEKKPITYQQTIKIGIDIEQNEDGEWSLGEPKIRGIETM